MKKNLKKLKKILKKPLTKTLGCGILTMQSPRKAFARDRLMLVKHNDNYIFTKYRKASIYTSLIL